MAGPERAINMGLKVRGVDSVVRDFKRVGDSGAQHFARIDKAANDADREISEYTRRLKAAAQAAKTAFDTTPGVQFNKAADPKGYVKAKNAAVLERVAKEKELIGREAMGLIDGFDGVGGAVDGAGAAMGRFLPLAAAAATALGLLKVFVIDAAQAWMEHEQALNAFEAELALGRTEVNASAAQIEAMVERVSAASGQSEMALLKAAGTLAKIPGMTRESMEEVLSAAAAFATSIGVEVPEAIERMAPVLQALGDRDMKALVEATKSLDYELAATILTLAEAGRTAEAQQALFDGFRAAVGEGDGGLTGATRRLNTSWDKLKESFGEEFAGPAADGLNLLSVFLSGLISLADTTAARWANMLTLLTSPITLPIGLLKLFGRGSGSNSDPDTGYAAQFLAEGRRPSARATVAGFEKRYGSGGAKPRPNRGGRSGKSDADREAEKLKREAEQARNAADRVIESNDDVIASYQRRAAEAEEKVGLEGEALKAVERRQAIEAVVRRINRDEIEKEVAARKAAAAASGGQFDEAAATREATVAVDAKANALRDLAEREIDAADATAEFARRQAQAKAILEELKTPLDRIKDSYEQALVALKGGGLAAADYDRYIAKLTHDMAELAVATDMNAQAWHGFGDDVGRTLTDFILKGGSALDLLRELVRVPLERLLQQQVANPVANWIDGLTGNNVDKRAKGLNGTFLNSTQAGGSGPTVLDPAAQAAAMALTQVQTSGMAAAQALQAIAFSAGNPIDDLAAQTDRASLAMSQLTPQTMQFGTALAQALQQLAGGGGGGGGSNWLGMALQLGMAAFGGGAAPSAALAGDVANTMNQYPGLFASGTDRLPVGKPFWVGENGRELMEQTRGGGIRVHSNAQSHRMAEPAAGASIVQNFIVPQRADPRRTMSTVARGTQMGLASATRKALASPAGGSR